MLKWDSKNTVQDSLWEGVCTHLHGHIRDSGSNLRAYNLRISLALPLRSTAGTIKLFSK